MKRVVITAGAVLLLGVAAGCSGTDNKGGPPSGKAIATTLTPSAIPDIGANKKSPPP
jgi:hypothetical protein